VGGLGRNGDEGVLGPVCGDGNDRGSTDVGGEEVVRAASSCGRGWCPSILNSSGHLLEGDAHPQISTPETRSGWPANSLPGDSPTLGRGCTKPPLGLCIISARI
jgi:hypothetical protein